MSKGKILIIEDNPMSMELFNELLKAEGYSTLQATNGNDGLEIAKKETPDVILLDPGLPDVDRIDIIKKIKKETKNIILVVCTASVMKDEKQKMIDSGCDEFIAKPINTREFVGTIAKFLNT